MNFHSMPEKIVSIRKQHRCWGCANALEIGTITLKQSGVHVGEGFWNGWFCERCASFIKTKSSFDWMDYQDGLYMGELTNHDDYLSHEVRPLNELKLI